MKVDLPARSTPGQSEGDRVPSCPDHLTPPAAKEWRRVARVLREMGVLTTLDRAALAAYCQAYGRWVEAEARLRETPMLFKTPSGYVQQSPWLGIANKQLELMGRFMTELGMTPASRSKVAVSAMPPSDSPNVIQIEFISARDRTLDTLRRKFDGPENEGDAATPGPALGIKQ